MRRQILLWSVTLVATTTSVDTRKDLPYDYPLDHATSAVAPEYVIPYVRPIKKNVLPTKYQLLLLTS